ncbi:hypothetical protein BDF14DRAFT_491624 [Spinellus fusiger]|nr:hypothetical protein BDF14DRAFT_491624 [Spinellus fusiger]
MLGVIPILFTINTNTKYYLTYTHTNSLFSLTLYMQELHSFFLYYYLFPLEKK